MSAITWVTRKKHGLRLTQVLSCLQDGCVAGRSQREPWATVRPRKKMPVPWQHCWKWFRRKTGQAGWGRRPHGTCHAWRRCRRGAWWVSKRAAMLAGERWGGSGFPADGNAQAQPVAKPSSVEEDRWKMGGKSLKMAPWPSQGW